ncbi:MAG: AbgT family transporter [Bermanella sp.]
MGSLLHTIERVANRLPHPMALFIYLCLIVVLCSWLGEGFKWGAQHPTTGEWMQVRSLMSRDGWVFMLGDMVKNFMNFAPVGPVLMIALAFSLAERSGLLPTLITRLTRHTRGHTLPIAVAFLGVMSSIAVDSGYVVLLPLCAAVFAAAGRHPLAGLALGFACVSGGFSANLMVGPVDAILSGISTEAVQLVADREVSILGNYYFMLASVPLIILLTVMVNRLWVEPYLKDSPFVIPEPNSAQPELPHNLGKAFWLTLLLIVVSWLLLTLPEQAVLRHGQTGSLLKGPFMASLVALIALSVAILATVYGVQNGRFKSWGEWVKALERGIADLAPYLVLMFVVAQFIAWFKWSVLGTVLAVHLAAVLQDWALSPALAMVGLMVFTSVLNLLVGSASAKWALLAPILVPAFYLLGIEPAAVQGAYRVADSSTNIITPLMPYFPLVLMYAQKYEKDIGVGRLLTLMLPYGVSLLLAWGGMLTLWIMLGIPLGPAS